MLAALPEEQALMMQRYPRLLTLVHTRNTHNTGHGNSVGKQGPETAGAHCLAPRRCLYLFSSTLKARRITLPSIFHRHSTTSTSTNSDSNSGAPSVAAAAAATAAALGLARDAPVPHASESLLHPASACHHQQFHPHEATRFNPIFISELEQ